MVKEKDLIRLLHAAIDGIDGYESEHGDLKYWNDDDIREARIILQRSGS